MCKCCMVCIHVCMLPIGRGVCQQQSCYGQLFHHFLETSCGKHGEASLHIGTYNNLHTHTCIDAGLQHPFCVQIGNFLWVPSVFSTYILNLH